MEPTTHAGTNQESSQATAPERYGSPLTRVLCDSIDSICSSVDASQVIENGFGRIVATLGTGFAAFFLVRDGGELTARATLGVAASQPPLRLRHSDPGLRRIVDGNHVHLWSDPSQVAEALKTLSTRNRARLASSLGNAMIATGLCVPLSIGKTRLGSFLLAGVAGSRVLDRQDIAPIQAVARVTALALARIDASPAKPGHRAAGEAQWVKTELLSTLSHQMRTPLASIKGYATALLLQGCQYDDDTRVEFLRSIDEEADNLSHLISYLLESSAMKAGVLKIQPRPVQLGRLAGDVVKRMARRCPDHRLLTSFPTDFPVLEVDPHLIEQVIVNLLDNAIKFSPDGGLIVVRGSVEKTEVVISVADQGLGLAPEHLNRLFERFYRVQRDLPTRTSGTGLGLPIARSIVEAHRGRIWAESVQGHGSTFHFTLPLDEHQINQGQR